jgi:hypothetical protein
MLETLRESLRQLIRYNKEFRIAAPKWPELAESIDDIVSFLESSSPEATTKSRKEEGLLSLAVEMGTSVWRLRRRLAMEGEVPEERRRVSRDLESAWDALGQEGIEVRDHTGEEYDGHMALRVIAFQPTPGLTREQITETIKPTIYHKDKLVQMGEVIVGVPEDASKADISEQK